MLSAIGLTKGHWATGSRPCHPGDSPRALVAARIPKPQGERCCRLIGRFSLLVFIVILASSFLSTLIVDRRQKSERRAWLHLNLPRPRHCLPRRNGRLDTGWDCHNRPAGLVLLRARNSGNARFCIHSCVGQPVMQSHSRYWTKAPQAVQSQAISQGWQSTPAHPCSLPLWEQGVPERLRHQGCRRPSSMEGM